MKKLTSTLLLLAAPIFAFASEADLKMPQGFAQTDDASILWWGFAVVVLGLLFGFWQFRKVRKYGGIDRASDRTARPAGRSPPVERRVG